jgi:hypothetical protein
MSHQKFGSTDSWLTLVFERLKVPTVSSLEQIEEAVLKLQHRDQQELRDWLENLLEDRLEMTDAFKEEIAAGKADIQAGRVRIRRP